MKKTRWLSHDEEQLRFWFDNTEYTVAEMAGRLNRSQAAVAAKLSALGLTLSSQKFTPRKCMCCGKEFKSAHSMNRLCGSCNGRSVSRFDVGAAILA